LGLDFYDSSHCLDGYDGLLPELTHFLNSKARSIHLVSSNFSLVRLI